MRDKLLAARCGVAIANLRKPLNGMLFRGADPFPTEDADHVDARRAAVGLRPLADYRKKLLEIDHAAP